MGYVGSWQNEQGHERFKCVCREMPEEMCCVRNVSSRVDHRQECRMSNVLYGINCVRCKKIVYVDETERTLKHRLKEHE